MMVTFEQFEKATLEVWHSMQDDLHSAEACDEISPDDKDMVEHMIAKVFGELESKMFTEFGGWQQKVL